MLITFELSEAMEASVHAMFDEARRLLGDTVTSRRVYDVEHAAQERISQGLALLRNQGELDDSPCRKGCAWCCHEQVTVLPPTLLAIHAFLEAQPTATREAVRQRVADLYARKRRMTPEACHWTMLACPFLSESKCEIYPVRPYHCQGCWSGDEDACRIACEQPEADVPVPLLDDAYTLAVGIFESVQAALQSADLAAEPLELVSGYHIMMTQPDAITRWLAGEDAFAAAALTRWRPEAADDEQGEAFVFPED